MKTFLVFLALLIPLPVLAEPAIVFQTEHHDFGTVRPGDKLEYTFEYSNAGRDDLVVSQVNTFT
jgi:hypothetical protein